MDEDDKRKIDDRTENSQHKVLNPVDRRYSRTPDSSNLSTRRLRSKSIGAHEPSNFLDEHRRAGFRQPATSQSVYPGFVANQQGDERNEINYPSTMVYAPASQAHARRPRSHSRSGSEQFAPRVDSSAPPVPSLPLGPILQSHLPPMPSVVPYGWPVGTIWVRDVNGRPRLQCSPSTGRSFGTRIQKKKLPMPSVIPPGWPDGTRWVRDRNGRPYLETPEQYRHQEHVSFQPLPLPHAVPQPQSTSVQRPYPAITQPPTIVSPFPQKPFLKRLFGGIVGGSKTPKTHGAVQLPLVNPSTPSQPLLRTKRRPRTKSF
ncbi:hypothetical protein DL96DRAFT_1627703 [Flagelloscypha sp. PMI_526]|nr:hypothetical protein DL96DRAFT_1627703 [Flagelloscypha sp. PMI_526]